MRALEPIYAAVFALAQSLKTSSTPFTTMSRRWVAWSDCKPEWTPALFQLQKPIRAAGGLRGIPKFDIEIEWYVYFNSDPADFDTVTSTVLNNYLTALISAIQAPLPGQRQTLGGLVNSVSVEGDIIPDEGIISPPAVLCIPITISTGF